MLRVPVTGTQVIRSTHAAASNRESNPQKCKRGAQLITGSLLPSDATAESGAAETELAELGHNP